MRSPSISERDLVEHAELPSSRAGYVNARNSLPSYARAFGIERADIGSKVSEGT